MLEGQLEGLMCASTWDKEVTENIEGKRSDLKVSKMLKITVLMPERRRDMALVEAAATTLKSSIHCLQRYCSHAVLGAGVLSLARCVYQGVRQLFLYPWDLGEG